MKFTQYILGALLFTGFLPLMSCSDDVLDDIKGGDNVTTEDDGMVDVAIRLNIENFDNLSTRASYEEEEYDIRAIDLLIYYLLDNHGNVLYQYGKGVSQEDFKIQDGVDDDGNPIYKIDTETYPALDGYIETLDNNQTLMKVEWVSQSADGKGGPYRISKDIKLRVMRGTKFKLCCWAQSSQSQAYDFNHLTAVKVNYEGAANNDKERDAFCAASEFSIGQVDTQIAVTLSRPLAQINVGVDVDADFEGDNADNDIYTTYNQSFIELEGVATYFNVVENKAWSEADYEAFIADENLQKRYGDIFDDTKDFSEKENRPAIFTTTAKFEYANIDPEVLKVYDYSGLSDTSKDPKEKYYNSLSMCYVLVPEASYVLDDNNNFKDEADSSVDGTDEAEGGIVAPTLKNVKIKLNSFAIRNSNGSAPEVAYPGNGGESIELEVKRNWRTNLLFKDWEWTKGATTRQ